MTRLNRHAWFPIATFFCFNLIYILEQKNGPFYDEGIYVVSGIRTLQGHGYSDGYIVWFTGYLIYPALAGLAYLVGGLNAARTLSLVLMTIGMLAITVASLNLFGELTSVWTAWLLAICAPIAALSHLAVYDSMGFACTAIAFWAVTELIRENHRKWLILAVVSFALGFVSKYTVIAMAGPLFLLLIFERRRKAVVDLFIAGFLVFALVQPILLTAGGQLQQWLEWRAKNNPNFGVDRSMIIFTQILYNGIPLLFGGLGWLINNRKLRNLPLLAGTAFWIVFHVGTANPQSDLKHPVLGFVFLYPLIALLIKKQPRLIQLVLVTALLSLGIFQIRNLENGWMDSRQGANYLLENVEAGDQLIANNSWSYTIYLFPAGKVQSPWDLHDTYTVRNNELKRPVCAFEWFVNERGPDPWPPEVLVKVERCFTKVYTFSSSMRGLAPDYRYYRFPISTEIWKNKWR